MNKILILILSLINFAIFAGDFDCEKEANKLMTMSFEELIAYQNSLQKDVYDKLRKHIINKYKQIFLKVIKPGLESFPYIKDKTHWVLNVVPGVFYVKFVCDGRYLIVVSYDGRNANRIDIIDMTTANMPKLIKTHNLPAQFIPCIDFSSDGQLAIMGTSNGAFELLDLSTGAKETIKIEENKRNTISEVRFNQDGKFAIACSKEGEVYKLDLGNPKSRDIKELPKFQFDDRGLAFSAIHPISISKDGKYAIVSETTSGESARLYDLIKSESKLINSLTDKKFLLMNWARFSPCCKYVYVSAGYNLTCIDISCEHAKITYTIDVPCKNITIDSSGKFAITSDDYAMYYVNLSTAQVQLIMRRGKSFDLSPVINPNGTLLVTKFSNDNVLVFWDTARWAINQLSLAELIMLFKVDQEEKPDNVIAIYNLISKDVKVAEIVKNFFAKKLMAFYFEGPAVLQTLVKEFMG